MSRPRRLRPGPVLLSLGLLGSLATPARAHPFSQSSSALVVSGRDVRATLTINLFDLHSMPDLDKNRDNRISYPELDDAIERIVAAVGPHFAVHSAGVPIQTTVERYQLANETTVRLDLLYRFASDVTTIDITSTLNTITQPDHRHLLSVTGGGATDEAILDLGRPSATFDTASGGSYLRTAGSFLRLGVEHIFTGYDHLAFLVVLLVATAGFRSLIRIVTSFTVAHSITLALATFDAVVLPTRVTESLIALSIAYVAAENLRQSRAIERCRITFLFGLVHGFGFAAVLRQMQLPRRNLALSLFSFNAGVELGQLLFVAIVFPMVLYLAASAWQNRIRSAVSSGIVCLSVYWFVQRAFR
ncbi:MAG: HupE/UreJ family protein [Acidobacteriota bacterium]